MFPIPIHIYFELAAFLTSVITWYKLRHTKLRWFLPFLFFIVVVELTGRYIKKEMNQHNAWLYNLSVPAEYLFYTYIYCIHYKTKWFRRLAVAFIIGFFSYACITFLTKGIVERFHNSFLLYGSLFMLLFGCLYFYEILKIDEKLILLKEPMFWVASGIFLFNAGEFFYNLFFNLLRENKLDNQLKLFSSINNKLIWVLFTCFSIAFIWVRRHYKRA